jgi:hypothetical protein
VQGHGARIFGGIKRVLGGIEAGYGVFSSFHFSSFFVYWELQDFAFSPLSLSVTLFLLRMDTWQQKLMSVVKRHFE